MKCIEALERMREIPEPIYGETENKVVNRDSDILTVLGNAHELEDSPIEVHLVPKQPWMLVRGRQCTGTLLRDIIKRHLMDSEEFLYVSFFRVYRPNSLKIYSTKGHQ